MPKIKYERLKHQDEFQEDDTSKILLMSGGFGSGKTYSLVMKILKLSFLNKPHSGGLVIPSYKDYKRDVFPLMEEILDNSKVDYFYHKTDMYFKFPWTKGKLYIHTAQEKIRGPNWAYAGINEVSLIEEVRFKETLGRVRVKGAKCPQVVCVATPEGIGAWTYSHFIEKPKPNTRIIYADTRDNPHLDETYIQMLIDNYDPIMLDAYLKGLFVNMNGNRFYYSWDRKKCGDNSIMRDNEQMVYVSMDFNVSPMAAGLWNIKGKIHYKFGEINLKDNADTQQMCDALRARNITPDNCIIFPDPAGDSRSTKGFSDIQILRNNGYNNIRFKNKAPSFRRRQLCINNLMSKGLIKVNLESCPYSVKDWEAVEQDQKDFSKIKKNLLLTHHSDGDDYFLDYMNPLSGEKPAMTSQRIR